MLLGLLAAGAIAAAAPPTAEAEVVWLCRPGEEPNPCRADLDTTVYDSEGNQRVDDPPVPQQTDIDCFYVYPTVSEQPTRNANKDKDAQVTAIAKHQAARYSGTCRVWAPVYRQQTLGGLAAGGSAEALQLAYSDVEEAWLEYLAQHNDGRGFVLIGHSQGTRMLRQLIRRQIDGNEQVRRRLVSAILLGGNVTVRKGQTSGGDFQQVPACTRAGETGCVIAFSTFNETPPENSRYGRAPAEDTSGLGFPAGPDYEVVCTNPASLGANERVPLSTYLRSEPFPGVLGALIVRMYGGPQPTAPTTWLQPQDHYTGRCEQRDGANVLMIEPIGSARKLNPSPDESWGLHLADGNIALGDLVGTAREQGAAYVQATGRAPRRRARLKLRLRCVRAGARLTVVGRDRSRVRRVDFRRNGRLIKRDRRAPFRVTVSRRGPRVRALVRLKGGGRLTLRRSVRACRSTR
jgi:pimeloyl-ACP methyl ester carboxylesterase